MADIIPPRRDQFLTVDGVPTQRFIEYLEQLTNNTNESTEFISASVSTDGPANRAKIFALENRLGSGDFLTSDETGFTVDATNLTVDMDEA
jgi:hypothetical protein